MMDAIRNCTIHGVVHIYTATNTIIKLLWSLLFLLGVIGVIINVVFVMMRYFSYPVLVSHHMDYENFTWPDITFCNPTSPFDFEENSTLNHWNEVFSKSQNFIKHLKRYRTINTELMEKALTISSVNPYKINFKNLQNQFIHFEIISIYNGLDNSDEYENKDHMSSPSKAFSKFFSTQTVKIFNNIPCHTLQLDDKERLGSNWIKSLIIILKLDLKNYKIFNSSYTARSFFLFLSNKNEIAQKTPIILYPGSQYILDITQTRYQHNGLKRPCRNKIFQIDLYDSFLTKYKTYEGDHEDCYEIMMQKLFVENCKCFNPFLPIYRHERVPPKLCYNTSFFTNSEILQNIECVENTYYSYGIQQHPNTDIIEKCKQYKPVKCDVITYKVDLQKETYLEKLQWLNDRQTYGITKLFSNRFPKEIIDHTFIDVMRHSVLKLIIKRQSEFCDLYKEDREFSFSELLSDIGGLMGLWLGMSLVGLFEIVGLLYYCIMECCTPTSSKLAPS